MPKHFLDEDDVVAPLSKRIRSERTDRLSILSDELLLRTLSFLPISDLVLCERLSRRIKSLAADSQLWKALFYDRFVRPRASRIPGIRDVVQSEKSLFYASRISRWLQDDHLVRGGKITNWKRQYKLRHNWSRGRARVSETQVADQPSVPPLLLRLHADVVITADPAHGLRAWSLRDRRGMIAIQALGSSLPTCMAIDTSAAESGGVGVSIGFADGTFSIHRLVSSEGSFVPQFTHPAPTNNSIHIPNTPVKSISAIAYARPYLLTMTSEPSLSLYRFCNDLNESRSNSVQAPILLSSLKSHSAYPPLSLSIRPSNANIVASIAYAMPTWNLKWSVGLQEIRLDLDGLVLESRMASASTQFTARSILESRPISSIRRPTSLSYTHPYLLTSHPDNTLTLYMVTSTANELTIGAGSRLWGHTSSISGAHVGDRGKAVSVSTVGNELRVWELEGGTPSQSSKKQGREASVQIRPDCSIPDEAPPASSQIRQLDESTVAQGWLAFDEEKVVLLREKTQGPQALVVYDFT